MLLFTGCRVEDSKIPPPNTLVSEVVNSTSEKTTAVQINSPYPNVADVVGKVGPAVVSIFAEGSSVDFFGRARRTGGAGSGIVFRDDGYILTNNHVVEKAETLTVVFFDGTERKGELVGTDPLTDLAVIRVDAKNLTTASLAEFTKTRVGEWVIAIGNALGLEGSPTVTVGIVSALERSHPTPDPNVTLFDLIQTDAAINMGNSGGPLVNLKGEVIGINTLVDRSNDAQGIGFAVNTQTALPVANELVANGRVVWPWLGVGVKDLDSAIATNMDLPTRYGVLVTSVMAKGPAEKATIQPNDVIIEINGQKVNNIRDFQRMLRIDFNPGNKITTTLIRKGKSSPLKLEVTLGEFPR
jgi:S1-C subfamily serine protease